MIDVGKASGSQSDTKAISVKTYNLDTNKGKIDYLTDVNSETLKGLKTKYSAYKDRPAYTKFEEKVMAEIERNKKMMKNPEQLTIKGGMSPKDSAYVTLQLLADSLKLRSMKESIEDSFGKDVFGKNDNDPFAELK